MNIMFTKVVSDKLGYRVPKDFNLRVTDSGTDQVVIHNDSSLDEYVLDRDDWELYLNNGTIKEL